jgi:hypothetical protein
MYEMWQSNAKTIRRGGGVMGDMVSIGYLKKEATYWLNQLIESERKKVAKEILDLLYSQMPKTQIVVEIGKRYGVKITD